jgi:hypothetical protein
MTHYKIGKEEEWWSILLPDDSGRLQCPLCPVDKFKANYRQKVIKHIQLSHVKHAVQVEGNSFSIGNFQNLFSTRFISIYLNPSWDVNTIFANPYLLTKK